MDLTRLLPLFPLAAVLFPGVVLPLHIFEDRYKLMVRRCRESDGLVGIVFIRNGAEVGATAEPYEVGTLAKITRLDALSEGKINLTVVGERRFRITDFNHELPYLRGKVEIIADAAPTVSPDVISEIRQGYVEYIHTLRRLSQRSDRTIRVPEGLIELSYAVAAQLQVSRIEQQALLEASPDQRLRSERYILKREIALLQRLGAVSSRHSRSTQEISPN
jgi:Lon protease-like protein